MLKYSDYFITSQKSTAHTIKNKSIYPIWHSYWSFWHSYWSVVVLQKLSSKRAHALGMGLCVIGSFPNQNMFYIWPWVQKSLCVF